MKKQDAVTAAAICLFGLVVSPVDASGQHGPRIVGEQTGVADLIKFLGVHSWKVRVVGPLHSVSAEVVQYVRGVDGQFFEKHFMGSTGFSGPDDLKAIEITVMVQNLGSTDRIQLMALGGGQMPTEVPKSFFAGYVWFGDGSGGTGLKVGNEDILMAKFYKPQKITHLKKDMAAYVALRITAQK